MIRRLLLSTTALASLSGYALAADLTTRPPPPPFVPPPPVFSWTGFYVGAVAGAGFTNDKTSIAPSNSSSSSSGSDPAWLDPSCSYYFCAPNLGSMNNQDVFATIGGTIGYNYEFPSNVVIGLEADFSWAGLGQGTHSTSSTDTYQVTSCSFYNYCSGAGTETSQLTTQNKLQSFGTLRARLGYAFDRTLVYVTGGLAFANVKSRVNAAYSYLENDQGPIGGKCSAVSQGNANWTGSSSKTKLGFTVGAGVEHALTDNVSVKLEALYYNLGSIKTHAKGSGSASCSCSCFFTDCGSANNLSAQPFTSKTTIDGAIVRLGLNVKF